MKPATWVHLAALEARDIDQRTWPGGLSFEVASYLTERRPPSPLVTSARAIVLRAGEVMVVEDPNEVHVWPGGRVEAGETFEEAMRREVLEETGWRAANAKLLGFLHYHHLQPKPANYAYLHPDFLQAVFAAIALDYDAAAKEIEGYELNSGFRPLQEVEKLSLRRSERLFLAEALAWAASMDERVSPV